MSIKAIDLRRGMAIEYKNGIWVCVENQKVSKGRQLSYQSIELKNLQTGQVLTDRFRPDENVEQAILDRRKMEFLYAQSAGYVVMDPETFEQTTLPAELIGDQAVYLTPNTEVEVSYVDGQPMLVELPNTVELTVTDTPPQVKGATATNQLKDAECEGGARIKVPPFIENGTVVKVDTRTGEYIGRA